MSKRVVSIGLQRKFPEVPPLLMALFVKELNRRVEGA